MCQGQFCRYLTVKAHWFLFYIIKHILRSILFTLLHYISFHDNSFSIRTLTMWFQNHSLLLISIIFNFCLSAWPGSVIKAHLNSFYLHPNNCFNHFRFSRAWPQIHSIMTFKLAFKSIGIRLNFNFDCSWTWK